MARQPMSRLLKLLALLAALTLFAAACGDDDPVDSAEWREMKDLLVQVISKLPETEQTVITLYYGEELLLKEIGELLVDVLPPNPALQLFDVWNGAAVGFPIAVPDHPDLVGARLVAQGVFVDPADPVELFRLTDALEILVGDG